MHRQVNMLKYLFLILTIALGRMPNIQAKTDYYAESDDLDFRKMIVEKNIRKDGLNTLAKVKFALVNGDLKTARKFLYIFEKNKGKDKLNIVAIRYKAILAFLEADFKRSYELLNDFELSKSKNFKDICWLKITNAIILNKQDNLEKQVENCRSLTSEYQSLKFSWFQTLLSLLRKNPILFDSTKLASQIRNIQDLKQLEALLKTALYLNQEKIISTVISQFPKVAYQSKRIRELLGLILYRAGDKDLAKKFIEDIETPNAETIKGNILLEEKNYELAYGHFKLALKRKENSFNALERGVSLAWTLEQFNEGLDMLIKLPVADIEIPKKTVLEAAFLTRLEKPKESIIKLDQVNHYFINSSPLEFNLLMSYNSLLLNKKDIAKKYADRACRQYDALSCWLVMQLDHWEDFSLTIKRTESTFALNQDYLAQMIEDRDEIKPLQEVVRVDQRDIEELDEQDISLNPLKFDEAKTE